MKELEQFADDLGQRIFAIETNLFTLERHLNGVDDPTGIKQASLQGITDGLEKLKELKTKLLNENRP